MSEKRLSFEVRAESHEEEKAPDTIRGYAAVFNQIARGEMIKPGAFTKTLQEQRDIKAYWAHDSSRPLGRTKNGTLVVEQDAHGLRVEIKPNLSTSYGRDALESVVRGDVDQMSFGMKIINAQREVIDGQYVNVLTEIRLLEVSPLANPWYEGTTAEAREKNGKSSLPKGEPEPVHADHSTRSDAAESKNVRKECLRKLVQIRSIMEGVT